MSLARGLLLWHGLAEFSTTEKEIIPCVVAVSCDPTAAGWGVQAAFKWENSSVVHAIVSQYLSHLCDCQDLPRSHIYPIAVFLTAPAPTLFMPSFLFSCTLTLIIFVSLLCRLSANCVLDSRSSLLCCYLLTALSPACLLCINSCPRSPLLCVCTSWSCSASPQLLLSHCSSCALPVQMGGS